MAGSGTEGWSSVTHLSELTFNGECFMYEAVDLASIGLRPELAAADVEACCAALYLQQPYRRAEPWLALMHEVIEVGQREPGVWPNPPNASLGLPPLSSADAQRTVPREEPLFGWRGTIIGIHAPCPPPDPNACIFVANLSWSTDDTCLKGHLQGVFDSLGIITHQISLHSAL